MVTLGRGQAELHEDVVDVLLDRAGPDDESGGDGGVGAAFCHQGEDLAFPWGEVAERVTAAGQELGDDLGVEGAAASGDTVQGVEELGDVRYPVFQQVADAVRAVGDQLGRVALLDPLGQDEDADVGPLVPHEQAKQLMAELRELIHGIQPQVLSDLGLSAALGELADSSPVPVTVDADLGGRLPGRVENTAYFVAAEALTNIAKHSRATRASVVVEGGPGPAGSLNLVISDDGIGGADAAGAGLVGLADRIAGLDGALSVESPPGGPTIISAVLPCG